MTENEKNEETALEARLLDEAAANEEWPPIPVRSEDRAKILAAVNRPDWERAVEIDDWKKQVPDILKELWGDLSLESRLIVFIMASTEACRGADAYYDAKERDCKD